MSKKDLCLHALAKALSGIFKKEHIQRAIVFGSLARGKNSRRSDIDLLLIKQTNQGFFQRYSGIYEAICKRLMPCQVDLLIYTPQELKQILYRKFIKNILKEGHVIYESGKTCL